MLEERDRGVGEANDESGDEDCCAGFGALDGDVRVGRLGLCWLVSVAALGLPEASVTVFVWFWACSCWLDDRVVAGGWWWLGFVRVSFGVAGCWAGLVCPVVAVVKADGCVVVWVVVPAGLGFGFVGHESPSGSVVRVG